MNYFFNHLRTVTARRDIRRTLGLTATKNTRKRNECQETDCCGDPINVPPKGTIFVERACHPCSFFTWKPKIPILESPPPLKDVRQKPFKKQHCYAGMKFREKSLEEQKKEALECQKRCAAKPECPPPPVPVKEKPKCDPLVIPEPDWDMNGCLTGKGKS